MERAALGGVPLKLKSFLGKRLHGYPKTPGGQISRRPPNFKEIYFPNTHPDLPEEFNAVRA